MRRKDREITDQETINHILKNCPMLVLGLNDSRYPYVVPLNYVADVSGSPMIIYFHCALTGYKLELIKKDGNCSFAMINDLGVGSSADGSSVTNYYESVIGQGEIEIISDTREKQKAVTALLDKYSFGKPLNVEKEALEKTCFGKIIVSHLTGKANRKEKSL